MRGGKKVKKNLFQKFVSKFFKKLMKKIKIPTPKTISAQDASFSHWVHLRSRFWVLYTQRVLPFPRNYPLNKFIWLFPVFSILKLIGKHAWSNANSPLPLNYVRFSGWYRCYIVIPGGCHLFTVISPHLDRKTILGDFISPLKLLVLSHIPRVAIIKHFHFINMIY